MWLRSFLTLFLLLLATPTLADPPQVTSIIQKMKDVFEPVQPSTRTVHITANGESGEQLQLVAHQARASQADGKRILLVIQDPVYSKGNALLIWEREGQPSVMWWYPPVLRRVRGLLPIEGYQRFFDTDLTYADLGYVEQQGNYRLLGQEERADQQTYKVEFVPNEKIYYSRIFTWISVETMLPVEREYYDVAGKRWKTMTFDQVENIDNIPTPLHMHLVDRQQNSTTDVTFSDVHYGVDLPDTLFDPERLPQTVEAQWWEPSRSRVAESR
jgi:outer membrane lipoprotein-sorting protein